MRLCVVEGCDERHCARGFCPAHYYQARQAGMTVAQKPSPQERFWTKVDRSGECWVWIGTLTNGYGKFYLDRRLLWAHRVSFEWARGAIPEGMVLDHLCRTPACVNPAHLEPVSQRENILRGESPMAKQARQTECLKGHPLSGANVRREGSGKRHCRACQDERNAARKLKAEMFAEDVLTDIAKLPGGDWRGDL